MRQCGTSTIPISDTSCIRNYEEELEVQDTNIWAFQVQQVEQERTIEEVKLSDKRRSPGNVSPDMC
jgi:hypothetical protein